MKEKKTKLCFQWQNMWGI